MRPEGARESKTLLVALIVTVASSLSPWPNVTGRLESMSQNALPRPAINNLGWPMGYIRVVNGEFVTIHWDKAALDVFFWFVVITGMIFMRHEFLAYRRFRRTRAGRCTGCGYDLRGAIDTCPECGQAREAAAR